MVVSDHSGDDIVLDGWTNYRREAKLVKPLRFEAELSALSLTPMCKHDEIIGIGALCSAVLLSNV